MARWNKAVRAAVTGAAVVLALHAPPARASNGGPGTGSATPVPNAVVHQTLRNLRATHRAAYARLQPHLDGLLNTHDLTSPGARLAIHKKWFGRGHRVTVTAPDPGGALNAFSYTLNKHGLHADAQRQPGSVPTKIVPQQGGEGSESKVPTTVVERNGHVEVPTKVVEDRRKVRADRRKAATDAADRDYGARLEETYPTIGLTAGEVAHLTGNVKDSKQLRAWFKEQRKDAIVGMCDARVSRTRRGRLWLGRRLWPTNGTVRAEGALEGYRKELHEALVNLHEQELLYKEEPSRKRMNKLHAAQQRLAAVEGRIEAVKQYVHEERLRRKYKPDVKALAKAEKRQRRTRWIAGVMEALETQGYTGEGVNRVVRAPIAGLGFAVGGVLAIAALPALMALPVVGPVLAAGAAHSVFMGLTWSSLGAGLLGGAVGAGTFDSLARVGTRAFSTGLAKVARGAADTRQEELDDKRAELHDKREILARKASDDESEVQRTYQHRSRDRAQAVADRTPARGLRGFGRRIRAKAAAKLGAPVKAVGDRVLGVR